MPIHVYYCCIPVATNIEPLAVIVLLSKHKTQVTYYSRGSFVTMQNSFSKGWGREGRDGVLRLLNMRTHTYAFSIAVSLSFSLPPPLSLSLSCSTSSLSCRWRLPTRTCLEVMVAARRPQGPGTATKSSLSYWSTS